MVKKTNLPIRGGAFQFLLQPVDLFGIQVVAVEREKLNVALFERIVLLAVHIKALVKPLVRIVVIAERGVEQNARVHQRLIGNVEFLL